MKKNECIRKQVLLRNLKSLPIILSLIMASLVIGIAIVNAESVKKEHQTKLSSEQYTYRGSTYPYVLDEYVRNQMFGRHNCTDSELGDLSDPGFPPQPTRINESINMYQLLQEDISNYYVYQKEMHKKNITVAFKKDFEIDEKEKEYLSEFIFGSYLCRQYFLF